MSVLFVQTKEGEREREETATQECLKLTFLSLSLSLSSKIIIFSFNKVTGNFIPNEYESKTQALWFQKFPWKDAESPISSDFEECLFDYIQKLGIRKESPGAEAALNGQALSDEVIAKACAAAAAEVDPPTDIHGSAEYRRSLVGTLLQRALVKASR